MTDLIEAEHSAAVPAVSLSPFAELPGDIAVSFEFFPPKSEKMDAQLWDAIGQLAPLAPDFVSVTYGAGGSTRERTHATVARIVRETSLKPAAHLTCVAASKAEIAEVAEQYWQAGVRHIVALRGDPPPADGGTFVPHPQGYASAADLDNLKRKMDAGATRAITQFFFTPEAFFRFRDAAAAAGITADLVPGILPVSNVAQVRKFAGMCGASIPAWMDRLFEGLDDHPGARALVAATVAAEMCRKLYAGGVRDFHFYTLNRAELSYAICHLMGLRPKATPVAAAA